MSELIYQYEIQTFNKKGKQDYITFENDKSLASDLVSHMKFIAKDGIDFSMATTVCDYETKDILFFDKLNYVDRKEQRLFKNYVVDGVSYGDTFHNALNACKHDFEIFKQLLLFHKKYGIENGIAYLGKCITNFFNKDEIIELIEIHPSIFRLIYEGSKDDDYLFALLKHDFNNYGLCGYMNKIDNMDRAYKLAKINPAITERLSKRLLDKCKGMEFIEWYEKRNLKKYLSKNLEKNKDVKVKRLKI